MMDTTQSNQSNEKNRKRGLGGVGVDDDKGLPDHSISVAPVGGFNNERGSDLGKTDDTGSEVAGEGEPVTGGNEFEFGSEDSIADLEATDATDTEEGPYSEVGGPAGLEARVLSNTGVQHHESSRVAAEIIHESDIAHDGVTGRRDGTRFEEDEGTGAESNIADSIMAKIRDLGDAIEKAGDKLKGEEHSKITDAFRKVKGRFGKTNDRSLGGSLGSRNLQ